MARIVREQGIRSWQGAASVVAAIGLLLAVASAVPGVRSGYDWLSGLSIGAPLRESHRFLALWLVMAAPASAVGAAVLADRVRARSGGAHRRLVGTVLGVPLVVALAISVPGWWGLDGRLTPVDYPAGWAAARQEIARNPGTVVALPWNEYPPMSFAGGRQVFNPMPDYLGGDVVSSFDPGFDARRPRQEQVDHRARVVDRLVGEVRSGEPIASDLVDLGVRWVVVAHEWRWERYASLAGDPGLEPVLALPDLDLYEVRAWTGDAVSPAGTAHDVRRPIPPLLLTDAPAGSVLNVAGAPGWVQGLASPVAVTEDGRLRLERAGGVVWFWPAVVIALVDVAVLGAGFRCLALRRARFGRILA